MTRFYLSPKKSKDTTKDSKSLVKKGYFKTVIYLSEPTSQKALGLNIANGDTLEINAEGIPSMIGVAFNSHNFDFTPFSLAKYFQQILKDKDISLTIDLRACNSGTIATENTVAPNSLGSICFARDFSLALQYVGFSNIKVIGYTGYIQYKGFKHSLVECCNHGAKARHCRLEDGMTVYHNGINTESPKTTVVEDYTFDLLDEDILRYRQERFAFYLPNPEQETLNTAVRNVTYAFDTNCDTASSAVTRSVSLPISHLKMSV